MQWLDALSAAVADWNAVTPNFQIDLTEGSSLSEGSNDGRNTVGYSPTVRGMAWTSGVLAVTLSSARDCYVIEADILMNSNRPWSSEGSPAGFDFQSVVGHELGHAAGLDHPNGLTNAAIMLTGILFPGATMRVQASDRNALTCLYGDGNAPGIFSGGVVSAASFEGPALTPGGIVAIFGSRLTNVQPGTPPVLAGAFPLPTTMGCTSVAVNGIPAPLFAVANSGALEQINVQVPWEVSGSEATVIVTKGATSSAPMAVPVIAAQPGLFTLDGTIAAIAHAGTGQLVTTSNPAQKGETVILFATGLGAVSNRPSAGMPAPESPLARTLTIPQVSIGGTLVEVLFSGLAPGFSGLYQLNVRVPAAAVPGELDVVLQMGGQSSKAAKISVQ
jgi:uncharacterized protein (TIGR03437 family)